MEGSKKPETEPLNDEGFRITDEDLEKALRMLLEGRLSD